MIFWPGGLFPYCFVCSGLYDCRDAGAAQGVPLRYNVMRREKAHKVSEKFP